MFTKHVWHDRHHQAEVFMTGDGVISGTIVAYKGAVTVINPRPEILTALYQEAKIKRILSIRAVILTDNAIEFTRGLCAIVGYSRGLRRRSPLTVITPDGSSVNTDFLSSCCAQLLGDAAFPVEIEPLAVGNGYELGGGMIRFVRTPRTGRSHPYLEIRTDRRTLHYYDESHTGPFEEAPPNGRSKPNVVIRAAELPRMVNGPRLATAV